MGRGSAGRPRRKSWVSNVVLLAVRLFVSAVCLGVAGVAGIVAASALSGAPDNTPSTNAEIGILAIAVCIAALVAVVTVWRTR
jgi:hypothetical protein